MPLKVKRGIFEVDIKLFSNSLASQIINVHSDLLICSKVIGEYVGDSETLLIAFLQYCIDNAINSGDNNNITIYSALLREVLRAVGTTVKQHKVFQIMYIS